MAARARRSPSGAPRTRPEPGARSREAEQQLDGRRLAGAVRAEQTDQLAASDGQAEAVEGGRPPVRLGDAVEVDRGR